jgi:glutamate/aspartate transport system substrate-binding protein
MRVMPTSGAHRRTARARGAAGAPGVAFAAAFALILTLILILLLTLSSGAQEAANVGTLSGTLKKVKDSGTITLGYRESSLPFSYLNRRQQPIGYSLDLCREIVEDVSTELDGMEIKIAFAPVTPANRLQKVASGEIDLECGSTTANVQRRKEVAFSPIFFVAGTKLMVPKSSPVRSYRDLAGKTAVVTAGTTNEAALRTLSDKQKLAITIITAPDHAQSLATLAAGKADAFATDDVLLYGFVATAPNARDMKVVGEYLSYDPYGLVYRRDDPAFAAVVERTFARMASERRLAELYNKWFLRRLPTGETLNLPISPQLEEVFRVLGQSE